MTTRCRRSVRSSRYSRTTTWDTSSWARSTTWWGDLDEAVRYYEQSVVIRPNAAVLNNMGAIYHARGEYDRAVAAYRQGLELRPNSSLAYRNMGDAYQRMGKPRDALDAYRKAVSIAEDEMKVNPRDARNLASLAVYQAKAGNDAEATRRLQQAIALAPKDVNVLYRVAIVDALAGRVEAALAALSQAIQGGYSRAAAASDEDFQTLRSRPEFRTLMKEGSPKE